MGGCTRRVQTGCLQNKTDYGPRRSHGQGMVGQRFSALLGSKLLTQVISAILSAYVLNHAHQLTNLQSSLSPEKWQPAVAGPYKARRLLSNPIYPKNDGNGPPSADQDLSTMEPRHSHAILCVGGAGVSVPLVPVKQTVANLGCKLISDAPIIGYRYRADNDLPAGCRHR